METILDKRTWIFQANPKYFDIDRYLLESESVWRTSPITWSINQHKNLIRTGDSVYLWRAKGTKSKNLQGIIAKAVVASPPKVMKDDDLSSKYWKVKPLNDIALRVLLKFEGILPPGKIMSRDFLKDDTILSKLSILRSNQGTNFKVEPDEATRLNQLWEQNYGVAPKTIDYNDVYQGSEKALESFEEGKRYKRHITQYERDPKLRKEAILIHGFSCSVCGFDFGKFYGEVGKEFIHIHHLRPISKGPKKVNPKDDLVPVCANCHSIIHRNREKTLSVEELKEYVNKQNKNQT